MSRGQAFPSAVFGNICKICTWREEKRILQPPQYLCPCCLLGASGRTGVGITCPSNNTMNPRQGVGIPADGGGRGICELQREKNFLGLVCFAAERRFQLQG